MLEYNSIAIALGFILELFFDIETIFTLDGFVLI